MTVDPATDSFIPTRESLLSRLRDREDQEGWREFFDTYWRLIYSVARRSGLSEADAQDVTQETLVTVARHMPGFRYDRTRGSFKAWLHTVIRSRVVEHWRRAESAGRHLASAPEVGSSRETDLLARVPDPAAAAQLDAAWNTEWEQNLLQAALRRVQTKVSAHQYLIFSLASLKEIPVSTICQRLDVNVAQVYLARHRVGRLVKAELKRLRDQAL